MSRRRGERTILFPWERRRGIFALPWARTKPALAALAMIVLVGFFGMRERDRTGMRATRATLLVVHEAIDAFRADHELQADAYLITSPTDAWGRPLQLTCPGRRNPDSYDLLSYGPSGDMRGLDRIE